MKKFLTAILAAAMMFIATDAFAQLHVGFGYTNSAENFKLENIKSTSNYNGFFLGGGFDMHLYKGLSIDPGFYYSFLTNGEKINFQEHMVEIPVDVKYSFDILSVMKLFAYAGPTFQFQVAQKASAKEGGLEFESTKSPEDFSKFDVLLGGGIGVDVLDMIRVNVGYRYGLVNLNKTDAKEAKIHRGQVLVGVSYIF